MNVRAKGRRNELKSKRYLEERGWEVELVKGSTKYNTSCDFFGLWDGIAMKNVVGVTWVLYFQTKSNRKPVMKNFINWKKKYPSGHICCVVHVWNDRMKEPEIYSCITGKRIGDVL